jgi:hypothetical protein
MDRRELWTRWLGLLLGVGYLAAGIGGWIGDVTDGDNGDLVFWLLFLVGGGALLLLGLLATGLPPRATLALQIVGALAGALALLWSILVPILAIVFVVLTVLQARNRPAVA